MMASPIKGISTVPLRLVGYICACIIQMHYLFLVFHRGECSRSLQRLLAYKKGLTITTDSQEEVFSETHTNSWSGSPSGTLSRKLHRKIARFPHSLLVVCVRWATVKILVLALVFVVAVTLIIVTIYLAAT
jgi:hypothetical protein